MDFFEHQERARKRTGLLILCYGLAVTLITLAIYALFASLFAYASSDTEGAMRQTGFWIPELALWVAIGVPGVIIFGTVTKLVQLGSGGKAVAKSLGGIKIDPGSANPDERKLLNIVEEMAIASGIPVPDVYLLNNEPGINAFAAGFSTRDAVIGVTRGCLDNLSRDELQGVIAHEFSHIVNGDMRLNIRLMGVLFGILMITVIGRMLFNTIYFSSARSSRDRKGGNPLPFIGIGLMVIGTIGVFFANIIKSAVSRQREFLADASAVQFTRNPAGIAGALQRIGGLTQGSKVKHPRATEASHLFFGEFAGKRFFNLMATHPPLQERISRLDPQGLYRPTPKTTKPPPPPPSSTAQDDTSALEDFFEGKDSGSAILPGAINLAAAAMLMQQMPKQVQQASQDALKARALLYALLCADDSAIQQSQITILETNDPETASLTREFITITRAMPPQTKLPAAERLMPAMRSLDHQTYKHFRKTLTKLIEADQQIDLFEFALHNMIIRHVSPAFEKVDKAKVKYRDLPKVMEPVEHILTTLADWGNDSPESAAAAYQAGLHALGTTVARDFAPGQASLANVQQALETLAQTAPFIKRKLIEACKACVLSDGEVTSDEYELLRAIADAIDVPMPPLRLAAA